MNGGYVTNGSSTIIERFEGVREQLNKPTEGMENVPEQDKDLVQSIIFAMVKITGSSGDGPNELEILVPPAKVLPYYTISAFGYDSTISVNQMLTLRSTSDRILDVGFNLSLTPKSEMSGVKGALIVQVSREPSHTRETVLSSFVDTEQSKHNGVKRKRIGIERSRSTIFSAPIPPLPSMGVNGPKKSDPKKPRGLFSSLFGSGK